MQTPEEIAKYEKERLEVPWPRLNCAAVAVAAIGFRSGPNGFERLACT